MKTICVFCSANNVAGQYVEAAEEFARLIAEHGYDLVWGGSDRGLMKVMADTVEKHGGRIIGISMEMLKGSERKLAYEMIIAKDLSSRKALLLKRSDALVLLVGGLGSLDEVTEMLELKKHDIHHKPIIVLNTNGFYDGLKQQLQRMKKEGFIRKELIDLIVFTDTPDEAIRLIDGSLPH